MTNDRPTIGVLGATFTTGNMGVSALAAGTISCLLHRFPAARLFFLDYQKKGFTHFFRLSDRSIPVEFVNIRFSKKFFLPNNIAVLLLISAALRMIPWCSLRRRLARTNMSLRWLQDADLIVSMNGGDSFSDIYGMGRFLYGALPIVVTVLLNKRLVILPQTLGPFRSTLARAIARYILNRAEIIYSRDYIGITTANELMPGSGAKVQFGYDVAFGVNPRAPREVTIDGWSERARDTCIVGLNVSGLLYMGGYTRHNMFGLRLDYRKLARRIIDMFAREKGAVVLLVPHVFGLDEDSESDVPVCKRLYEDLRSQYGNHIACVSGTYDESEIKYIIGMCDFFVGSRMHACIAAISQSIPTVSIAYSDKFLGVMESIQFGALVADGRKMHEEAVLKLVDEVYRDHRGLRCMLQQKMNFVRTQALELLQEYHLTTGAGRGTPPIQTPWSI